MAYTLFSIHVGIRGFSVSYNKLLSECHGGLQQPLLDRPLVISRLSCPPRPSAPPPSRQFVSAISASVLSCYVFWLGDLWPYTLLFAQDEAQPLQLVSWLGCCHSSLRASRQETNALIRSCVSLKTKNSLQSGNHSDVGLFNKRILSYA